MTFDSLGGNHHVAIDALRSYLRAEALDKKGVDIENKLPIRGKTVPVCPIAFFLRNTLNFRFPFSDSRTTKFLRLWHLCWTSGRNHIQVSCRVLATRLCKSRFLRQYRLLMNCPQSRSLKNRLTGSHPLWDVGRFKDKRNELRNLITRLSEQWKEVRGKTALAPLPDSSTPPASEAAAKEDKVTPLLKPNKRKARSAEPMEDPEEDEVIILEGPAAKRQQRSPRKTTGGTPRKGTGSATRSRRYY